jgi:exopolysaccharide production protein ExoQ
MRRMRAGDTALVQPALQCAAPPVVGVRRQVIHDALGGLGRGAERTFAVVSLLLLAVLTGGIRVLSTDPRVTYDPTVGDPMRQAVFAGIYAVTAVLVMFNWREFFRTLFADRLLLVLVLLAAASVLWSDVPAVTLRRVTGVGGATMCGAWLATRFDMREQIRLLSWALGGAALLSLLVILLLPARGISTGIHEGAWRGVFTHKQLLGQYMALGSLALLFASRSAKRHRWLPRLVLVVALLLLVFSASKTALVATCAMIAVVPLGLWLRSRSPLVLVLLTTVLLLSAAAAIVGLEYREALVGALGRDVTLTGRTVLWQAIWHVLQERYWLGWGMGAFWLGWIGESAAVWAAVGWTPSHAHNGFLELWLSLGLIGVAVFLAGFAVVFVRALRWLRSVPTFLGLWPLMFMLFFMLYNIPSRMILGANELPWVIYVTVALTLARRGREP